MIVIFVNRPGQSVLDRNYGAVHLLALQGAKNVFEPLAGHCFLPVAKQFPDGFLTEGAPFALKRDALTRRTPAAAHLTTPSQRFACGSGSPVKSRTRSIV